jgi:hypothetical protein
MYSNWGGGKPFDGKWDSLKKHVYKTRDGKWLMDPKLWGSEKWDCFMLNYSQQLSFINLMSIRQQKKKLQFTTILKLLSEDIRTTNYKDFQPLFEFLKLQSIPQKT